MKRRPYHPLSDLKEFPDLAGLIGHILESINVEKVVAVLPANVDLKMIDDPVFILPIYDILVGDATFSYIRYDAKDVMINVADRIAKIVQNTSLSFDDK